MSEQLLVVVIEASLRATLLAMLVGALLWLLRIPRGAPRHTAWLIVVIAMILMPALQRLTPALPAPISPRVPNLATLVPLARPQPPPETPALDSVTSAPVVNRTLPELSRAASSTTNQPARVSRIGWFQVAASVYALIAIGLLLRVLVALGTVWTIYHRARPLGDGIFESRSVATPVTVGLVRPRIVLPTAWADWPEPTRQAVIAHERAHAKRRDPLVALLTRLNSCVFWFHPLAWWLERTLADAAEQACDEVGVRAVPNPRQYAEVLLTMATASRQAGGRIVWAGVSVEGRGRLGDRIERILLGHPTASMSWSRKSLVVAGCIALVTVAVACRSEQPPPPLAPPVFEDTPERVEQRQERERYLAVRETAQVMTWDQVSQLEDRWRQNRDDLETLEKLLFFYEPDVSGKHSPDDPKKIAARRPLILWLIEHHPESQLLRELPGRIFGRTDWLMDPDGYEAAKKLWLAHAARPDVSAETLRTAAWFLDVSDKPLAEKLLLEGQRRHPKAGWAGTLGRLYARTILGSNRFTLGNVVNSTSLDEAHGGFAAKVRAILDASRDPLLLSAAGGYLATNAHNAKVDFDHVALARTYVERAIQLDPKSESARYELDRLDNADRFKKEQLLLARVSRESIPGVIATVQESERLPMLLRHAFMDYLGAESAERRARNLVASGEPQPEQLKDNRQQAGAAWQRSKTYAQDALELAKRLPTHPDQADALFAANVALGAIEFRRGDRPTAVSYMLAAAEAPPSTTFRVSSSILSLEMALILNLLKHGERETVIQYFERSAEKRPADRERLLAAANAIRNGKLPFNFERR